MPPDLTTKTVPLDRLRPYSANPRNGDTEAIKASLRAHGQYRAILTRKGTGEILAGNHTYAAALELGYSELLVHEIDCDDDQAARIVLADNRTNDLAGYDQGQLAALLQSLPDLDGTGWDQQSLDRLLADIDQATGGRDTQPGDPPTVPRTQPGDLYTLGDHRLLCGDATDPDHAQRLMAGDQAVCMWTDPPYGVSYTGKTKGALTIQGDTDDDGRLLHDAFAAATKVLRPGAAVYVAHPAGARALIFTQAVADAFDLRQGLVWNKGQMVPGHADYHYAHEPILLAYSRGGGASRTRRRGLVRRQQPDQRPRGPQTAPQPRPSDIQTRRARRNLPAQQHPARWPGVRAVLRLRLNPHRLREPRPPLPRARTRPRLLRRDRGPLRAPHRPVRRTAPRLTRP